MDNRKEDRKEIKKRVGSELLEKVSGGKDDGLSQTIDDIGDELDPGPALHSKKDGGLLYNQK